MITASGAIAAATERWTNIKCDVESNGAISIHWIGSRVLPSGYRGKMIYEIGRWTPADGWIANCDEVCEDLAELARKIRIPGVKFF
jgi:hypothetical protein